MLKYLQYAKIFESIISMKKYVNICNIMQIYATVYKSLLDYAHLCQGMLIEAKVS